MAGLLLAEVKAESGFALHFDGATGYLQGATDAALNPYPFAVTAWFRTTNTTKIQGLVSKYVDASGQGWSLIVQGGRLRGFFYRGFSSYAIDATSAAIVADGGWHHAALVVDAAGGRLLLDGVQVTASSWVGAPGAPVTAAPLQIGRYYNYPDRFDGDIDEVSIWNQALHTNSVNYIKHRSLSGTEDGLVGLWRLDEGVGTTTADATPAARTVALLNSPQWITSTAPIVLSPVATNALILDGANDYVAAPDDAAWNAYPLTITAWARTSRNAALYDGIVSRYPPGSGNGYSMFLYNGRLRGWFFGSTGSVYNSGDGNGVDGGFIADGNWHHVAFVISSTDGALYVDGVQRGSLPWVGTPSAPTTSAPLLIGRYATNNTFTSTFSGSIDEVVIWNRTLVAAELQTMQNRPLVGDEPNLIAYWRFDESSGTTAADSTVNGHDGTLLNGVLQRGSLARLGDGSVHLLPVIDVANLTRTWAVRNTSTAAFPIATRATVRRFYDYGDAPAPQPLSVYLDATLADSAATPIALRGPATATNSLTLGSYNASDPVSPAGLVILTPTLPIEPDANLDSVNSTHAPTLTLSHEEVGGAGVVTDEVRDLPARPLLHFNGTLYFGDIPTTFSNIVNSPLPDLFSAPDFLQTRLQLAAGSGRVLSHPEVTFGGGSAINVNLAVDGTATNLNGSYTIGLATPIVTAGVRHFFVGTLNPSGVLASYLYAFLPPGFGAQIEPEIRAHYPYLVAANVTLNASLDPATDPVVFNPSVFSAAATQFYFAEETKPVLFSSPVIQWNVAAGEFYIPEATTLQFVRQSEDDALIAAKPLLRNPPAADRISNDGYYHNAAPIPGVPIYIRPDPVNGSALVQIQLELNPSELRPHLPYTGPNDSGPVPAAGGRLAIQDDLIDAGGSYLLLSDVVPVPYGRDCADTNCSGASLPRLVLPFAPAPSPRLEFTPDGGLLAYGSVPAQNLTFGYTGTPNQFAHRTSDVEAGAYHMPGTFLRGDVPASENAVRPAVLLFTGFGDAADPTYVERPGTSVYNDGFANYAGVNFRAPLEGRSYLAGRDTGTYPLVPEAKYYARFGGVSGLHQAASFPSSLTLSGYAMTFSRFALSFLDSENWESRTDGRLNFPAQPAGFFLDFERMKFLCRGSLSDAKLPPNTPEKHLNYWNTDFQPLSMEFREATNRPCAIDERFLVIGVQTKLPFIPEALHASLAVKPNGNFGTVRDGIRGADSRFPVPGQLSLQGSGGSFFKLSTANEGYFNNWETPGRPSEGFYNLAGRIDLPFFEDSKVHLHITPLTTTAAKIDIMGGWRAADQSGSQFGWNEGTSHFFNTVKFDDTHRGFPARSVDGSRAIGLSEYRNSPVLDFHPRAQHDWIEVAKFDYPLVWNATLRQFASFEDSKVILPIIDVDSRLKELTPGNVDLDFAQDLDLKLPRIKLLDLANDAINEINSPLNSLSNVVRQAFVDLTDASGLTKGFRSMQRALRDQVDGFFRPVLEPALNPIVDTLYTRLATELATNPANFTNRVAGIVNDATVGLQDAIRNINGVASQANSVAGQLNGTLTDIDNTLGLFIRIVEKGGDGKRHVVQLILQKLAEDQAPALGIVGTIADPIASDLLKELEPTLAKVEERLKEVRSELNKARGQLDGPTGDFNKALGTVTGNANALSDYMRVAGSSLSNLMAGAITPARDYFTANPAAAKQAIRERLMVAFLSSQMPSKYQQTFKQFLYDDDVIVNQLTETLFQQINQSIRNGISSQLGGAKDGVFSAMKGPGLMSGSLASAQIRGAPTFNGDALKKIRLDAKVKFKLPDDLDFTAYMEIRELDSQSVPLDCIPAGAPAAEIIIGAADVPLSWPGLSSASGVPLTLTIEARWTQQSGNVIGVGGLILIKGEVGFKGCLVREIGATMAFGELETYFAAKAAGQIIILGIPVDIQAGLFVGKACTLAPIVFVDPEAGKVLGDPLGFRGVYVQFGGGVSLSEILFGTSNCFLDVEATVSTATYYQDGPRSGKLGMRQKLALDMSLICLISGHADLALFASAEFGAGGYVLILGGEANVCGELGYCPFCIEGCAGITIKGEVRDGSIDYSID